MFTWLSHLWTYINGWFETKVLLPRHAKFNRFQQQHNLKRARDRRIENAKVAQSRFNSRR